MAGGKVLAVCQSGGEFVKNRDGNMSYSGGEAHAIDIDRDMTLSDLKAEISSMFKCRTRNFSIKYFLPNNKRTPITVSSDKDLQRMVDFHGDSLTTDIYILKNGEDRKIIRSVVDESEADSDTPTDTTGGTVATLEETKRQKVCTDWDNLITGVGQTFDGPTAIRDALHKYAIAKSFTYRFVKNDSRRLTAECTDEGCPWRIHASRSQSNKEFTVKKLNDSHTCGRKASKKYNRLANQKWVASVIKEKLRASPNYKPKDIKDDMQREYGLFLNYSQAWRGKFFAKQELHNSHEEACSQLPWFCEKILETNPGSVATVEVLDDSKFNLFVAFHASLSGFEHGCRPLLFLDGISLNAAKQWKLLVANAVDGENCIFPIGFSVVDEETRGNWYWFLTQLKSALSVSRSITFISNRENGLEDVTQVFEGSYHGYCVRHLTENFKKRMEEESLTKKVKEAMLDSFQRSVYACKVDEFNDCIESITAESKDLSEWILATKPELWSNAYFKGLRYGHYSLNASETFNSWITTRYEPSVVQIVDMIRCKIMEIIYTRRQSSNTWREILTPSTNKKVQEEIVKARDLDVICSTSKVFEVRDDSVHVVNVETWECTCRRWQVTGFPCVHALAVLDGTDECIYDYCSKYFTTECHRLIYALSIFPIPDSGRPASMTGAESMIEQSTHIRRPVGRPRKRPADPRISPKRAIHCTKCKGLGHNKKTCKSSL